MPGCLGGLMRAPRSSPAWEVEHLITLGLDPHPASHTVAALDEQGTLLASLTVPKTPERLGRLHGFAAPFLARRWAIEGADDSIRAVLEAVVKTLREQLKVLGQQLRTVVAALEPELLGH